MCSPPAFGLGRRNVPDLGTGVGVVPVCVSVRETGREGGHGVTTSFSPAAAATLEPASWASHAWPRSAGRVPPPQDAVLFTQLAGLGVEALTCPSVTSRVGLSRPTAD